MDRDQAMALIEADRDFRLLRRVPDVGDWKLAPASNNLRRAVFVDTETTGLDADEDEVIELAMLPFDYDRDSGAIVAVHVDAALAALRQPSKPIPPESAAIHGIRDEDVAGKTIDPAHISALLDEAQLVIAHNAAFDRPMVEKLWPVFETKHWACSLADIDWRGEGLGSSKLDYLLMRQGWFFDDHRALADALAATFLLTLPLPRSGKPAFAGLLECARRPLRAVRAIDTAFEQRAALKARGYRWDAGDGARAKAWWTLTDDPQAEIDWLNAEIYEAPREIPVINVPATRRYSARLWPSD